MEEKSVDINLKPLRLNRLRVMQLAKIKCYERGRILEDDKLILMLLNEPEKGMREGIISYGAFVKMICINILGSENKSDIEECMADTFVKMWQCISAYDSEKGSLKGYVAGIARHSALDRCRKIYKDKKLLPLDDQLLEVSVDMAEETQRKMNEAIIKEVVNHLQEPDREIFIRRYFYYESIKTISEKLGLNTKKIENTLFRGKKKLQEQLAQRGVIKYE